MSPVYQATAIVRDRRGREVASRYPLWRGDVGDQRAAAEEARLAARTLAADERVDTVLISITGPKGERVTTTEYGDDLRAGRYVSTDLETLRRDGISFLETFFSEKTK